MVAAYPRKEVMVRICEAVEKGYRLHQLAQRPGWPSRMTVYRWTLKDPLFARQMISARQWRYGMKVSATAGPVFDPARAEAFLMEVKRGRAVRDLVRRPEWPNRRRLNRWKSEGPEFVAALAEAVALAARMRLRKWEFYDEAIADEIIQRVNAGETMARIEAAKGLPGKVDIRRWKRLRPDFAKALRLAQRGGQMRRSAKPSRLSPALFDHILTEMTTGASLRQVAQAPGMPHYVTLMAWQRRDPEFAKMLAWAREEGRWARGAEKVARADALPAKAYEALNARA
ncbi:hypothetical protein [Phenylobacterium sp.]|uniref:terminase small subunit-like protein n=1 Tax=Phenylobacterium sp. TaxID=1871053 RepID=UPI00271DF3C5|nr:hypothetical protein [Phenylobacterium sp.]MDO8799384.1 hypothetical protein [Phenylobacterium sp.]